MSKIQKSRVDSNHNDRVVMHAFSKDFPQIVGHPISSKPNVMLNSDGYRSDEFITNHNGLHILFSGCSTTFGDGLQDNEIWATQVYNKIKSHTETSGFFNIGTPGQGITYIVFHIFKYIKNFGRPDVIFINFPVSRRFVSFDKKSNRYVYFNVFEPEDASYELWQTIPFLEYQYIFMLEEYCKSNDIILIYGTWDTTSHFNLYQDLDYFIEIKDQDRIARYVEEHPEDKFALTARDGMHYGTAFHAIWADVMYNNYMNRTKNDG